MYFGLYQISSRHRQFDALPYDAHRVEPGLFATFFAWLRRILP